MNPFVVHMQVIAYTESAKQPRSKFARSLSILSPSTFRGHTCRMYQLERLTRCSHVVGSGWNGLDKECINGQGHGAIGYVFGQ